MSYTIVTGASQNHFKTLSQFIASFLNIESRANLVVYNLGIENDMWDKLKTHYNKPNIIWRVFDYEKYPPYLNINISAGQYAWKPVIFSDTCKEFSGIVIWMDSGDFIYQNFHELIDIINESNIYTALSSDDISRRTHRSTIDFFGCYDLVSLPNRNGACVGVNYDIEWVKSFVDDWKRYALIKECIAPEGSDRSNHRQDQSILSILYYKYHKLYGFKIIDNYIGYSIHNDID